jgi:hypothetical protein
MLQISGSLVMILSLSFDAFGLLGEGHPTFIPPPYIAFICPVILVIHHISRS